MKSFEHQDPVEYLDTSPPSGLQCKFCGEVDCINIAYTETTFGHASVNLGGGDYDTEEHSNYEADDSEGFTIDNYFCGSCGERRETLEFIADII